MTAKTEITTGNVDTTGASGVIAHLYSETMRAKAEAEGINDRYQDALRRQRAGEAVAGFDALDASVDPAFDRWVKLEDRLRHAPVLTVADARVKIALLRDDLDNHDPECIAPILLETCEKLIAMRLN